MQRTLKKISVVVPMYNEQDTIAAFFEALLPIVNTLPDFDIICVSDGSVDDTVSMLTDLQKSIPQIHIIEFSRNFGKEAALLAGLQAATGCCVVPIDADLQHPPELIPQMVARWEAGVDMVIAVNKTRETSWLRKLTSKCFYRFFNAISQTDLVFHGLDYRLMDRSVVNVVSSLPEKSRFFKGLSSWATSNIETLTFDAKARAQGNSKWSMVSLWRFALDAITSFSSFPLRVWSYVGVVVSLVAFIYMMITVCQKLFFGIHISGYASLLVAILFLGGIQLLSLGIIGEYISRIYTETKNRSPFVIKQSLKAEVKSTADSKQNSIESVS